MFSSSIFFFLQKDLIENLTEIFLKNWLKLCCSFFQIFSMNEDVQQHNAYKDNFKNYGKKLYVANH